MIDKGIREEWLNLGDKGEPLLRGSSETWGLDIGQKAGASIPKHLFRYSSMICLHIVSMLP